ncbi:MAG: HepT-like ribonuclease domain-containing protein [Cyanobacteria bacterium P01_F01_bin.86]
METYHEYFQVDLRTVWRTIQRSLPPLVEPLLNILEQEDDV